MAVPDFQSLMLPLMQLAREGHSTVRDCIPEIARRFDLSEDDLAEMLPSRRQHTLVNRLHWARTYLAKAGLLRMVKRGVFAISPEGEKVLASSPERVDMRFLKQFEAYRAWKTSNGAKKKDTATPSPPPDAVVDELQTPEDRIASATAEIEASLADDLLARVLDCSPAFFERLIVDLLVEMGYGRGQEDAGRRIGRSGDGGIDGIINEDALGLDAVYIQAKRYQPESKIGRPAIQQFVGSLTGEGATKGVFVTTSDFSTEARDYVRRVQQRIVLINGAELARLLIAHEIGVRARKTYVLRSVDEDYFIET